MFPFSVPFLPLQILAMATFTTLPAPVHRRVLGYLDQPADLLAAVISCRPAYDAFRQEEARVLVQLVVNHFGANLADAVALATAPVFDAAKK